MGSLKQVGNTNEVQKDFLSSNCADIVADPSAPDAFVNGIMESKEWVWDNGLIREAISLIMQTEIKTASKSELENVKLKVFENFLQNYDFINRL